MIRTSLFITRNYPLRSLYLSIKSGILYDMDLGQVIFILSRLVLGAVASFLAMLIWSRTRDVAWMLLVVGVIVVYVGIVYDTLTIFGIVAEDLLVIGSMPLLSIILPSLPLVFFIAAFAVAVSRKYRRS